MKNEILERKEQARLISQLSHNVQVQLGQMHVQLEVAGIFHSIATWGPSSSVIQASD